MDLKIGFLGMSDNRSTSTMLDVFDKSDIEISSIIFLKPNLKTNLKRLKRKLKSEGIKKAINRILFAIKQKFFNPKKSKENNINKFTTHYVEDFSSKECLKIIKENDIDLLLLCTDEMIKRSTFSLPNIGTLNAHPGWIPTYRGLGAIHRMVEDGFIPYISVHFINEGVDTGPLVIRDECSLDVVGTSSDCEIELNRQQAKLFIKAIKILSQDKSFKVDTFIESSNMTRGFSKIKYKELYKNTSVVKSKLIPMQKKIQNEQ